MERETGYVTHRELIKSQDILKKEILRHIDETNEDVDKMDGKLGKVDEKVDKVDEKVDHLRDIVLPLVESSKQTAENTRDIAKSLKDFVSTQQETNTKLQEKQSIQDLAIQDLNNITGTISAKKKANGAIIVAVIGGVTTIIGGIIAIAPKIFQLFGG